MYGTAEWCKRLVDAGLWTTEGDGYRDTRYFPLNPSSETVAQRRAQAARRQALVRDPALRNTLRARDKDQCRYCRVLVKWSDRKGRHGGTYDHIDPRGPNSVENLVVACRSCNSSKKDRTPEEAGMILLPPPNGPNLDTTQTRPRSDPGGTQNVSGPRAPRPPSGGSVGAPAQARGGRAPTQPPPTNGSASEQAKAEIRSTLAAAKQSRATTPPSTDALDRLRELTPDMAVPIEEPEPVPPQGSGPVPEEAA